MQSDIWDPVANEITYRDIDSRDYLPGKDDMVQRFRFQTPWTYNVSLGYTVGNSLALGAEYEYQDYSSKTFRDTVRSACAFEWEKRTKPM